MLRSRSFSATPMSASFPLVAAGTSGSQTITLQNDGTSGVTISSAAVTGAGFSTSGLLLPIGIAAGQRTTFNVMFTPSSAGNAAGSVSLVSDAPKLSAGNFSDRHFTGGDRAS